MQLTNSGPAMTATLTMEVTHVVLDTPNVGTAAPNSSSTMFLQFLHYEIDQGITSDSMAHALRNGKTLHQSDLHVIPSYIITMPIEQSRLAMQRY